MDHKYFEKGSVGGYNATSTIQGVSQNTFLKRVYLNLTGAILALAAVELLIFAVFGAENLVKTIYSNLQGAMIGTIIVCLAGPFVLNMMLQNSKTRSGQYVVLGLYVIMEALILTPLLSFAAVFVGTDVIWSAIVLTVSVFLTLTAFTFATKANFTFLAPFLMVSSIAALVGIVLSLIFGFTLGVWFSVLMIVVAAGYILYETSLALQTASSDQDVAVSIMLFTSVMTLFFYILRLLMQLRSSE